MAPFASGPAPRWEPGSARTSVHGIGAARRHRVRPAAAAAAFLRPPPFLRPAAFFFAAPFFAAAFFFPAALRPAFFGAAAFLRVRALLAAVLLRRGLLRCGLASGLLLRQRPSCGRPPASPAPARVAVRWLGFLRYSSCRSSFSCRWLQSRGRTATGPAILRGMSSATRANAAHARKRDEPTRCTSAPS